MQQDIQNRDQQTRFTDPDMVDWENLVLPDAWPDKTEGSKLIKAYKILKQALAKRRKPVQLPDNMPGATMIPKYVLQEFHNLPNGNYSKQLTRGYISSVDKMMLGTLQQARKDIARQLHGLNRVLDAGCASGLLAAEIQRAGANDVWALDPSPYLLQHAARDHPGLKLVQALAEATGFSDKRFQAVSCCFLLHELPPKYIHLALQEFARICQPGGLLCIAEPSPLQMQGSYWQLFKSDGFKGLYFKLLAAKVYEPFVTAWHQLDMKTLLAESGFELITDNDQLPIRIITARRR